MSNPDHIRNIHRINRIMGQLKGVEKMIVEKNIVWIFYNKQGQSHQQLSL